MSGVEIQGYTLEIGDDLEARWLSPSGAPLKSVPAKVRKDPAWQRWLDLKAELARRHEAHARLVEDWMVSGQTIELGDLVRLYGDRTWRRCLSNLLVQGEAQRGLLVNADAERGAGIMDVDGDTRWVSLSRLRVLHPAGLDVAPWEALLVEESMEQGIEQVFRAVARPDEDERNDLATSRFEGIELRSTIGVQYALNHRGWSATSGLARRRFVVRDDEGSPRAVTAIWAYAGRYWDYGDAPSECSSGELYFDADGDRLRLGAVPPVAFAEACRTVDQVAAAQRKMD